jgi:hypothetical protein
MLAIVAALPAFAAPSDLVQVSCALTRGLGTAAADPFVPHDANDAATGFGRLPLDSVVECFGGSDPL